jgi:NADH-quinone oxidoreductase chain G
MIRVNIDGKEIELEKPVTILEAARKAGITIPTLCHFEGLRPYGGCRLCLVEVEKMPRLQTSCTVMVVDGMSVKTETEQIRKARRAMLEFLLINHPLDCPYCDKAGECKLQDLVARYGPDAGRFTEGKRRHPESIDDPFIVRNMERCVLCTRCVRMCNDLQGAYAITVTGRGGHSFVEPFRNDRYDCEYCGNCLTVCPVGAIMSKLHRYSYRAWFVEKEVESVCGYCGVGCTMYLQVRENSIIRTIPKMGHGLNNGLLCVRGRFGYDYIDAGDRLSTPLIRRDGELTPVDWEEAISYVAERLKDIKESYGGSAIGAVASGRCTNEDNYMLQKLIRFGLGSNNIDSTARFYFAPAVSFLERIFGQGITANLIPGIANSDGVLVAGGDPTAINPILGLQVRASWRNGGKVVVLGPSGGLKRFVDYELITPPVAEEVVLSAITARLLDERELSGENRLVEEKIRMLRYPSDQELELAGVSPDTVLMVARDLLKMTTPTVIIGPDILMRGRASKSLFLLGAIAYIINARIFVLSEKPNYQGLMDMGCTPTSLPGGRPIEFEMFRHKIEDALGLKVPTEKGLTLFEMIDQAGRGDLKALYVMGENPLFNFPDSARVRDALGKLELLIVQDIYMTETARIADVVLPAAGWSEKDGTFTNLGRRLQRVRSARKAIHGREDWRIIAEIAKRIGLENSYRDVEEVWEEISHLSPLHAGLSYEDIAHGPIWPYHGEPLRGIEGEFSVEGIDNLPELPSGDTQYISQERPLYHSGTLSRRSMSLLSIYPEPSLKVNSSLSESLGLSEGERVKITSERGALELKVRIDSDLPEGEVLLSNIFEGAGFMGLTGYSVDPCLGSVCIEPRAVRIEKVEQ